MLINYYRVKRSVCVGLVVPMIKGHVLNMHVKYYKISYDPGSSWFSSKNVPVAIDGHFLPLSIHLQPKQLLVTVTVLSLPFVADYIIEVRKVRQTVLISYFLLCL